jgi:hypothetical protein
MSKSALKSSRQPSVSKRNKKLGFNPVVSTLSDSSEDVELEDMVKNQENQTRIKNQYKQQYTGFKYPYSRSQRALQQEFVKWQSDIEYKKAKAEKREEEFNYGRKWTVDAVKDEDDGVTICSMLTGLCKTISKTIFGKLFWKKPVINTTVTVKRGGKRTQKKRKFNTRKRRPKV